MVEECFVSRFTTGSGGAQTERARDSCGGAFKTAGARL